MTLAVHCRLIDCYLNRPLDCCQDRRQFFSLLFPSHLVGSPTIGASPLGICCPDSIGEMSSSHPNPRAAYCEEYSEDAHTTLPDTRQTANIAAKRSRPDFAKPKLTDTRDERSDSGNSSQTVATLNSGHSSLESKAGAKPLRVDIEAPAIKRRPALVAKKTESRPLSPQKSSHKRSSSKARDGRSAMQEVCICSECKATARKSLTPLETSWPAALNQQLRSKQKTPVTPHSARPPLPKPTQDAPLLQPAQARPRASTLQSYRNTRPMSYHGAMPGAVYIQPQPLPVPIERRPPTPYSTQIVFPPPSYPPIRRSYFPATQASAPRHQDSFPLPLSPYEMQCRPQPRQWTTDHPSNRHSMIYTSSPVIEDPQQLPYIPRAPSAQPTSRPSFSYNDAPSTPREDFMRRNEDFYRMPPPPPPAPNPGTQHRPAIKHAATTSAAHPLLHHTRSRRVEDTTDHISGHRSPKKEQAGEHHRSRRPSLASRPSATPSNEKPTSHSVERGLARMGIESNDATAKNRRRVSYYDHETAPELERVVETYQADTNTAADAIPVPITTDSLKLVRKKTHSDSGSRASAEGRGSREGSDVKPRSSTDRRNGSDVKARNDNDGVTLRFHPSSGVNLDVKGGSVEGRTISLRQSREGDGEMELSIGAKEKHSLSRTASRNEGRERHQKRYPSVTGPRHNGELEVARSTSRMMGERETGRERKRSVAGSRSRRSSKSGYSGKGTGDGWF